MNIRSKKAKVTPETVAEAQALSELWKSRPHPSQAVFGETFEIGNQSAVGQFLRGETPLSPKAAFGFAKGLDCSIADFSPRLANMFPVSRMPLEEALQCFASHLKLLDGDDRTIAAYLTNGMFQQPEKTDIYKSMLSQLLSASISEEIKAALLSRPSFAEAAKDALLSRPSFAEEIKAALLSRPSFAEEIKAALLSRPSFAEEIKAALLSRPSFAEEIKAALLSRPSFAEEIKAALPSPPSIAEAAKDALLSRPSIPEDEKK